LNLIVDVRGHPDSKGTLARFVLEETMRRHVVGDGNIVLEWVCTHVDFVHNLVRILGYKSAFSSNVDIAKKAVEAERMRRGRGVLSNPDISIARGWRSREKGSESELKPNTGRGRLWFRGKKKTKLEDPAW
jgi:hypothetical protein